MLKNSNYERKENQKRIYCNIKLQIIAFFKIKKYSNQKQINIR